MDQEPVQKKTKFQALQQQVDPQIKAKWQSQQFKIRNKIEQKDNFDWSLQKLRFVAGVDLSASKDNPNIACAGLVIYDLFNNKIEYEDTEIVEVNQPYIPGFLAFREIPPLYALFMRLKLKYPQKWPQLLMVDGNGILHCNQCGLASHLGVILNIPCLGVGKTLFYIDGLDKNKVKQQCHNDINKEGQYSILVGKSGRKWGAGLRMTKQSVNPVFVSVGHRISLQTAIKCVLKVSLYRVPEPIRLADKITRQKIQEYNLDLHHPPPKYQMIMLQ